MSMGGTGKFGYSTRDPLSRYLDPPGRPDSFISLSQSGKNFLTSDKYLDGAKRRHFPEPPQGIAIADVNYGIYKQPPPAPDVRPHARALLLCVEKALTARVVSRRAAAG